MKYTVCPTLDLKGLADDLWGLIYTRPKIQVGVSNCWARHLAWSDYWWIWWICECTTSLLLLSLSHGWQCYIVACIALLNVLCFCMHYMFVCVTFYNVLQSWMFHTVGGVTPLPVLHCWIATLSACYILGCITMLMRECVTLLDVLHC